MGTILSLLVLLFYAGIIASYLIFGLTPSISEIYYKLQEKCGLGVLFSIWMMLLGILTTACMVEQTEGEWYQFLGFFSGVGLVGVGAAPYFKESFTKKVHYICAILSGMSIFLITASLGMWYIYVPLIGAGTWVSFKTKESDTTYWIEQALFALGFIYLIFW